MTAECGSTVLYTHGGGRFGNQLLRFLHWVSWVIEHQGRHRVVNMAFWPYAALFKTWIDHPGCSYPAKSDWADRLARARNRMPASVIYRGEWRMQRLVAIAARAGAPIGIRAFAAPTDRSTNLADPSFLERVEQSRRLVVSGWEIGCWELLERHEKSVRQVFNPAPEFANKCATLINDMRKRHDVLVGLLIRRSDYRLWCDARYYFPLESYARWLRELVGLYPGCTIGIVIAGDEIIPDEMLSGLPAVFTTGSANLGGHWFESFLQLAECDLVVSPPSTFAACAAFIGDRPYLPLRTPDQRLDPSQILSRHLFDATRDRELVLAIR